jgi:anti-anti-sigma factor
LVPLVGGLHIIARPSDLDDPEGPAGVTEAYGQLPPATTDMTVEGSFDPVSIETTGPTSAVLSGELDLAAISTVQVALARFEGDLSLDCSGLTFIDAAGLRTLVDVLSRSEAKGTRLVLVHPSRCLVRLLELTNLSARFDLRFPELP